MSTGRWVYRLEWEYVVVVDRSLRSGTMTKHEQQLQRGVPTSTLVQLRKYTTLLSQPSQSTPEMRMTTT